LNLGRVLCEANVRDEPVLIGDRGDVERRMGTPAVLVTVPVRMSVVEPTWALDRDAVNARRARMAVTTARLGLSITGGG
jgi:hypothetical protein